MGENTGAFSERHAEPRDEAGPRAAAVQSHVCVLVAGADGTIRALSENCRDILGRPDAEFLGRPLDAVFPAANAHALQAETEALSTEDPVTHLADLPATGTDGRWDVTMTRVGAELCFEIEPAAQGSDGAAGALQARRLARRLSEKPDLAAAAQAAAEMVAALTGFARVSVHRIGRSGLEAALGLAARRPLAGAPGGTLLNAHARAFGPHLHLVADVASPDACRLVAAPGQAAPGWPDLRGLSGTRPGDTLCNALTREGVRAAMTVPVRVAGDLWGVVLCHHDAPRAVPVSDRGVMMFVAQLLGSGIAQVEHRLADRARDAAAGLRDAMAGALDEGQDLAAALGAHRDALDALIPHDGRILWHRGRFAAEGHAVTQDEFEGLFTTLHRRADRSALALDRLSDIAVAPRSLDPRTTALMVIPIAPGGRDFLLLFRKRGPGDDRLHGWESWEIAAGNALRAALIELQLKLAETSREARLRTQERQGLVIAELNHRMRNTLNLIQGLVGQTVAPGRSVETYSRALEARILALAHAHDDLAEHDWGRVGLRVLLERELDGALDGPGPAARISGDPIDLSPAAFTTMALVLHELASNARAHGALGTRSGRVDVEMSLDEGGSAQLVWTETGGPAPVRPVRPGFGLTIIERSIPHELHGTAELEFAPGGLVARFVLPPGHFTRLRPEPGAALSEAWDPAGTPDAISIDGTALILDDSLIIAIESAELLRAAGASEVHSCNSVESALSALDRGDVTFALLDVNLGRETSLPVAEQLWIDGIPAVLATGYGGNEDLLADFPPLPVLSKPFTVAEIKDVLRHYHRRGRS